MKKHYFRLLGIMLCALLCSNAFAEKLAYGFHMTSSQTDWSPDVYLCKIDVESATTTVTKIADYTETPVSGVYAEDCYYLLAKVNGYTGLYKVDLKAETPTYTTVAEQIKEDETVVSPLAMTYDPAAKQMYVAIPNKGLYTLNLTDGTVTLVTSSLTKKFYALACSSKGDLYGYDYEANVVSIDKETGALNTIDSYPGAFTGNVSLFFDYETDLLYCYHDNDSGNLFLTEINLKDNTTSDKPKTQWANEILGLSFIQTLKTTPIDPPGVRTTYGFNYTGTGTSLVSFDINAVAPIATTSIEGYNLTDTPQAGVNAKDVYYTIAKNADGKSRLYKSTDVTTGNFELVTTEATAAIEADIRDMAYDSYLDKVYAIANDSTIEPSTQGKDSTIYVSRIYAVNLTTGAFEGLAGGYGQEPKPRICSHLYLNMAALTSGQLYGITTDFKLEKILTTSGAGITVGTIELDKDEILTDGPQDLEFDLSTWTLYWSYQAKKGNVTKNVLAVIDPTTAKVISKTEFAENTPIGGLYFPAKEAEPTATWFGYCYSNDNRLADEYAPKKESFVTFDPTNLASIALLPNKLGNVWSGAQGEDGKLYTFNYSGGGMSNVSPGSFSVIDVKTWEQTKLFDVDRKSAMMADMTYDFSSSTFYFVSTDVNEDSYGSSFYSLNIINGAPQWKKIGQLKAQYAGIACNLRGEIYALNMNGELCKLNKITGAEETVIEKTGIAADPEMTASLEFDHNTETLYLSYYSKSVVEGETRTKPNAYLAKIDLTAKTVTQTIFPGRDHVVALYIPFERDPNIPGKVTDFLADPALYGALRAELTWTNPEKTLGGEPLENITSIEIIRNGEVISTITKAAKLETGADVSYTDRTPGNGFNNYIINVINEAGAGVASSQLVFIGEDIPVAPLEVKLEVENGTTAILTWKAPNIGINTGYIDKTGLSYKIVRQPDNVIVERATSIYTFSETIDALNYYYYEVTATGAQGTSEIAQSNSAVIGTAMSVPYECDFMSDAELGLWTVEGKWEITYLDGEEIRGLLHDYTYTNPAIAADDWAYSPAILLSKDKTYKLKFDARDLLGANYEKMNVFAGTDRTAEAQTVQIIDIPAVGGNGQEFETYEANFNVPADGIYYLGFHCYSIDDLDADKWYFQLHTTNINLTETPDSGIESNDMNGIQIYAADGKVCIEGEYTSATVYDQMGVARSIDATLATGVYFVKVMNGNEAKTYKVLVK